tara:strand:- start:279 stop:2411 length:2133 start_codon:yes stop_codon:yes gene_type:complete
MALAPYKVTVITKEDNPYNVIPNAPIEIRARLANGTSGGLSLIYSDSEGASPITQTGATADANGEFVFYAEAAEYNAIYQAKVVPVDVGITPATLSTALINDLSQAYEFPTVAAYKAFTTDFPVGKIIHLLDRKAEFTIISGTGTANELNVIANANTSQSASFNPAAVVDIRQVGVVGNGVIDDTAALQVAVTYPSIVGHESLNVRTTTSIFITNPIYWDMAGMKLLGESTGDVNCWVYIRSSDVDIINGQFGDGTVNYGKAIVIGDYGDAELFFRNINILNNYFLMSILYTQQAVVSGHGRAFEVTISGNRFQSTHTYVDAHPGFNTSVNNIAAIFLQKGGTLLGSKANQSWVIENNRCISFPYFFNAQISGLGEQGVTSGFLISKNIISNGMMGLRVYHIYDCIVSENILTDMTDTAHIWQRSTMINNKWVRCGMLTPENRPSFKVEAGTSLNIQGNEIRESLGDGCRIDGGNSDFTFGPGNMIYKSGGAGILVATDEYPGQITGLSISGNRVVESAEHGIRVDCDSTIRGITISHNHIAANGLNNTGDVAGIYFSNPSLNQINDATIAYNTIRNNDVVGGIQTAKTKWAVQIDAPGVAYSQVLVTDNVTHTELLIDDTRTSGTGESTAYNNFTFDISDPQLVGWIWSRNYDRTDVQIANRRQNGTPVGSVVPVYLGEEFFDTGGQNWYKGVGASLGPWTNADWKLIS